jgi:hypothetical protein
LSQKSAARLGFVMLVAGGLLAAAAVAGVRLGWLAWREGWQMMFAATAFNLGALGLGLVWLAAALRNNHREGRRPGLAALLGAVLLLWPPLAAVLHHLTLPPIHDFTTDTENPPAFAALLKFRRAGDNPPGYDGAVRIAPPFFDTAATDAGRGKTLALSEVLHNRYQDLLKPRAYFAAGAKDPVATFFWRDFNAVKKTGWDIIAFDEKAGRIEAVQTSFWFGRISDIVIRVRRAGAGARTDIRSQSRSDRVDDGANQANVRRFFSFLSG